MMVLTREAAEAARRRRRDGARKTKITHGNVGNKLGDDQEEG